MTQIKVVKLFGVYALLHGLLSLLGAIGGRGQPGWVLLATEGVVGLWAGVMTLVSSLPSPLAPIMLIWFWAVGTGLMQIGEAIRLRREISGDLWLALGGLVTLCFGAIVWLLPLIGIIGLAVGLAVFALVWGIFELLLGQQMRSLPRGGLAGGD
jgi:uncharacterized membrane protein HdeD (DUF308 family)